MVVQHPQNILYLRGNLRAAYCISGTIYVQHIVSQGQFTYSILYLRDNLRAPYCISGTIYVLHTVSLRQFTCSILYLRDSLRAAYCISGQFTCCPDELDTSCGDSQLTPGRPVPALILLCQAPGWVTARMPVFKLLVGKDRVFRCGGRRQAIDPYRHRLASCPQQSEVLTKRCTLFIIMSISVTKALTWCTLFIIVSTAVTEVITQRYTLFIVSTAVRGHHLVYPLHHSVNISQKSSPSGVPFSSSCPQQSEVFTKRCTLFIIMSTSVRSPHPAMYPLHHLVHVSHKGPHLVYPLHHVHSSHRGHHPAVYPLHYHVVLYNLLRLHLAWNVIHDRSNILPTAVTH